VELRKIERIAAGVLTLLAIGAHALRLVAAGALWRDEAATAALAALPSFGDIFRLLPYDSFPLAVPLAIRSFAGLAGQGDVALRVFGLAVGLGITAALWLCSRISGRALPLLSLALLSGNAAFMVFGDSLRGYGLGCLFLLLSFAALARLLERPGPWPALAVLAGMLGAVHCLIANAALVAAMGAAAIVAALAGGLRRVALLIAGSGLVAGLSLLIYAAPFAEQRSWSVVLIYPTSLRHIAQVLWAMLGPPPLAWVWLGLVVMGLGAAFAHGRRAEWGEAWERREEPLQGETSGREGHNALGEGVGREEPGAKAESGHPDMRGALAARSEQVGHGEQLEHGEHEERSERAERGGQEALGCHERDLAESRLRRFCALTLLLALAAQLLFLAVLSYTPRAWYYLSLLALAAVALEPLVAGLCRAPLLRAGRVALALAVAGAALPAGLPHLRMRMTNVEMVAHRVEAAATAGDLVLVTPWNFGISWNRAYHGAARWMTVPELADHRLHRYDLIKARIASPGAIDDVLAAVRLTLAGGHRVWLVGQPRFPPPGRAAPVLAPAPAAPWGWHDLPYMESWALQVGALRRDDAATMERVPVDAGGQPVSPLEDMALVVAAGWRGGGVSGVSGASGSVSGKGR
jgi:hypothetical protein